MARLHGRNQIQLEDAEVSFKKIQQDQAGSVEILGKMPGLKAGVGDFDVKILTLLKTMPGNGFVHSTGVGVEGGIPESQDSISGRKDEKIRHCTES